MKQQDFENIYVEEWLRFESQITNYKNEKSPLETTFPEQYRQICAQLSLAKQRHYSDDMIRRLNTLVMAGHHILYQQENRVRIKQISNALYSFIRTLRDNYVYLSLASILFILPAILAGLACYIDETLIYSLISPAQVDEIESMYNPALDKIGRERGSDTDLAMFGYYINNNIGIAFRTFAGGIFFGLGSVFFLCFNGLYIGAVAGKLTSVGYAVTFYPFVIGHGAFELTAIVFSGAAGLMIGYALINPGQLTRLSALKTASKEAVKILYGAAFMLFIAAFLEAFWSSSTELPIALKLGVGAISWFFVFWFCFFSSFGRRNESV